MQTEQVSQLLEQLGQALSAGDLRKASACWAVPALVLSEDAALAVSDASEIEEFFRKLPSGITCKVSYRPGRKSSGSTC